MSVSTTDNASAGIPVLIPPEVFEKSGLKEGDRLTAKARWVEVPSPWIRALEHQSTIPRGVLRFDRPEDVQITRRTVAVQVHPFSVMEYRKGPAIFLGFVYCTADTRLPSFRDEVTEFFDIYKEEEGRHGRYLLAADMIDELWTATYGSPMELRKARDLDAKWDAMQLRLEEARQGLQLVRDLIDCLAATDHELVDQLASALRIPRNTWWGFVQPRRATRLVISAARYGKLDALREALLPDRPPIPGTSPNRPLEGLGPRRTEDLIAELASVPNEDLLLTFGDQLGLYKSHWYLGGNQSDIATQLVVEASRRKRFDELERLVAQHYSAS
jgi:hypothetical protein